MNKLGFWIPGLIGLAFFVVAENALGNCFAGKCPEDATLRVYTVDQFARCMPGECYLYEELVDVTPDAFHYKDGTRRVWSYRPLYYPIDNSEILINLHKKLCPDKKTCKWPYTLEYRY
jgi:hypothetical protein